MKKVLAAVAVAMTLPMTVMAWEPTGDVNVIVAYKAGSGTDTGARLLATEAQKYIPKTIIIQNLPGADGKIGWTKLVQSKPDGQTIGFINLPTFTTLAAQSGAPFSINDIVPIANHLTEAGVVAVKADSPYKTIEELVAAAKEKGNLKASTNGNKASNHTAAQLLAKSAGFKYKAIPYGGTADQLLALRQGEVTSPAPRLLTLPSSLRATNQNSVFWLFSTPNVILNSRMFRHSAKKASTPNGTALLVL